MYTNADGITGKSEELKEMVGSLKPDIIAITETKLREDIESATVFPQGYEVIRRDRGERGGGGTALLVQQKLRPEEVKVSTESDFQEYLVVKLRVGAVEVLVTVVYNPPRNSERPEENNTNNEGSTEIVKNMAKMAVSRGSRLLIVGDFNHKEIDWKELDPHGESDSWRAKFLDCVQGQFLHQHVLEPTRVRGSDTPSTLDLVITQSELEVENLSYRAPLGKSDHCVLTMEFLIEDDLPEGIQGGRERRPNFAKCDIEGLKLYFGEINWVDKFKDKTVQQVKDSICQEYEEGVARYVPLTKVGFENGKKKWFNRECQKAKMEKDAAWKAYRRRSRKSTWKKYQEVRNRYLQIRRSAEKEFEQDIAKKAKENPKLFHSFIRDKLKVKEQVVNLQLDNGELTETDDQICGEFNRAFQTVFTVENTPPPIIEQTTIEEEVLEDIVISVAEVHSLLKELNPYKAGGPDNIAAYILKECADQLAEPLTYLYKLSLRTGELPTQWKIADVIPIFKKKGRRDRALNYRPVSLTSVVCKIMEKILRSKIARHLKERGFLSEGQHGFREGRSTLTNLLEFYDKVSEILQERNGWADCIYLDFQKAFDSVPYERLAMKLEKMAGVGGRVLTWIKAYLQGRMQRVKVRGAVSSLGKVTSGVPQGSVLGPLLFLIYINDLPDGIKAFMNMFADDAKILKRIEGKDSCKELQKDLDKLQQWSDKWLMKFNTSKCKVMKMGKGKYRPDFGYSIEGKTLESSENERDLGVIVMPDLSPEKHIATVVRSAYALLANIRVAFKYLDKETFKNIYLTYVRPKLEYAAPLWNPYLRKHVHKLERVQRHATKMVPELRELSYRERLERLEIPSLQSRRERGDMITVYKYVKGLDIVNCDQFFDRRGTRTRGHNMRFKKKEARRDVRKHFFSVRVVDKWNALSSEVVEARNIHNFKARYDRK